MESESIHQTIASAALSQYIESGDLPGVDVLAEQTDLTREDIHALVPTAAALRSLCERALVAQAAQLALDVPDFDDLPLEERLGTFVFILLDVFEQNMRFVSDTFPSVLAGPLTPYERAIQREIRPVLDAPDVPGINRWSIDSTPARFVAADGIMWMVRAWLNDDSSDRRRSTALIDRSLAFMSATMTNPVPQKGIDLLRYTVEAGYLPLDRLPIIGDLFGDPEATKQEDGPEESDEDGQ